MAIDEDGQGVFRADQLPWIAPRQPLVGTLALPAVFKLLAEDAVLVADAVSKRRKFLSGERVKIAGRQTPQSTVAETGLDIVRQDFLGRNIERLDRFVGDVGDA